MTATSGLANVSIVIPMDLNRRARDLRLRALALTDAVADAAGEVVIALAERGTRDDYELDRDLGKRANAKLVRCSPDGPEANLSALRNRAVEASDRSCLLFLDADIAPDAALFASLADKAGRRPWAMAPCLYLSRAGLEAFGQGTARASLIEQALAFDATNILHWAMPSSVIAMERTAFDAIGGFDETYRGHGYEDLDFMLRFALHHGLVDRHPDLLDDQPYRAPLLAKGFRSALATQCLDNLFDGDVALHLFHPRDNDEHYYRQRETNAALFAERFASLADAPRRAEATPPLVAAFFEGCATRGLDPSDYAALFDARPRHMLKRAQISE